MPVVSSDSLQLSHVKEVTPGVTPASPAFLVWRTTGESLTFSPQTSESGELGGSGRFKRPSNVTGTSIGGDINFELARFPALEEAMAGVLAGAWGECPLTGAVGGAIDSTNRITVGKTLQTFTVEKRFPNPAFKRGTIHTVSAATAGTQTVIITAAAATAAGTGMVVIDFDTSAITKQRVMVPIKVGDDEKAVGTAIAAELNKITGITATDNGDGTVTLDAGAGETVDTITASAAQDEYFFQRYKGVTFTAMSFSVSPNSPVTGSVTIAGGAPELDVSPLPGATYASAGNNPVFTAPQVVALSVGKSMAIGTHCWTSLTINIDSQNRGIACIGTQGDREVVLGTLQASVSGDVYFSSQDVLDALLNNRTIGDSVITLSDAQGQVYRFDFYQMKPTTGQLTAGGAGQDLTIPLTLEPAPVKVCEDASNNPWDSGFILSKVDSAPTLP